MILDHISYWRFIIVICLMADVLKRRDTKCGGSESISRRYSALSPNAIQYNTSFTVMSDRSIHSALYARSKVIMSSLRI
jgi:hypothetical protein